MGKFACVIHPIDIGLFSTFEPRVKGKREDLIKKVFEWSRPDKLSEITGLRSLTGKESEGILILYNLLPEQILSINSEILRKRIIEAGKIAEDWGADIFGLAAYLSQIGKNGVLVAKNLNVAVTTGSAYTIIIVIEAILKAAKELEMDLREINLTIIGATGVIGRMSAQILSNYISNITLVSRNKQRLETIAQSIETSRDKNIYLTDDINKAITNADIIMTATNTPSTLIDIRKVQPGTLVCDVSLPRNVSEESAALREDVLVIDGGIVNPPGDVNFNIYYGLPLGLCYACMAEAMILALEERYEYCSLGGNITLYKVKEIEKLAVKHGFKLAEFRSFNKEVSNEHIKKVRNAFLNRKISRKD